MVVPVNSAIRDGSQSCGISANHQVRNISILCKQQHPALRGRATLRMRIAIVNAFPRT